MLASFDNFQYHTNDSAFYWSINNGQSEPYPRELDIVKRYQQQFPDKNHTFIDVGGHIGTTSLPYSRLFHDVIAFEPNKESYNFFTRNISINNVRNVMVYNKGVYKHKGHCKVVQHNTCNSGCFYIRECDASEDGAIGVVPLDGMNIRSQVDYIKIDTEGSELFVLEGAKELIKTWKPLLQIETNYCSTSYFGYDKSEIFKFVKNLGYEVFDDDGNNPFFYFPIQA